MHVIRGSQILGITNQQLRDCGAIPPIPPGILGGNAHSLWDLAIPTWVFN